MCLILAEYFYYILLTVCLCVYALNIYYYKFCVKGVYFCILFLVV